MSITILEGQDLVAQLHQGTLADPPWGEFLRSLCRRMGADTAALWLHDGRGAVPILVTTGDWPKAASNFQDSGDSGESGENGGSDNGGNFSGGGGARGDRAEQPPSAWLRGPLRAKRVYALEELPAQMLSNFGLNAANILGDGARYHQARALRIEEPSGAEMELLLLRARGVFSASDGAILGALADHVEIALRTWAAMERQQMRASLASDAMRRLNFGWFMLDCDGHILDQSAEADAIMRSGGGLMRGPKGKLLPARRDAQAQMRQFLQDVRGGGEGGESREGGRASGAQSLAIHLRDEPWLDMLLTIAAEPRTKAPQSQASHDVAASGKSAPIIAAYIHGEQAQGAERSAQLMQLFGLTLKEAELAQHISRGVKIAEAAELLGLTLESTRLYSKRIYAKTGTRGQADLVRLILASIVALS